jgi:hypothetical protein
MTDRPVSNSISSRSRSSSTSLSLSTGPSPAQEALAFFETLLATLPARSLSDRTGFRRLAEWLAEGVRGGRFTREVFPRVLLYARGIDGSAAKNPNAVFLSILRKEMGYVPKSRKS